VIYKFPQLAEPVSSITLTGDFAITGCTDGRIRIYDVRSGQLTKRIDCFSPVNCLSLSYDETIVAAGTENGSVLACDIALGNLRASGKIHSGPVTSVSMQPNGALVLSGSADSTAVICDIESIEPLFTVTAHKDKLVSVQFSPDGQNFSTCSLDHRTILWRSPDLNASPDTETESEEELPREKTPPIPEPEPEIETQTDFNMASPIKPRISEVDSVTVIIKKPKVRSSIVSIGPVKKLEKPKLSAEDNEFLQMLRQAANMVGKLEETMAKMAEHIKKSDDRIARLEAAHMLPSYRSSFKREVNIE
jgi:WD40 repeat protein